MTALGGGRFRVVVHDLVPTTEYTARARFNNEAGWGAFSTQDSISTPAVYEPPPKAPVDLVLVDQFANGTLVLSFAPDPDDVADVRTITGFLVTARLYGTPVASAFFPGNVTDVPLANVTQTHPGETLVIEVVAERDDVSSGATSIQVFTMAQAVPVVALQSVNPASQEATVSFSVSAIQDRRLVHNCSIAVAVNNTEFAVPIQVVIADPFPNPSSTDLVVQDVTSLAANTIYEVRARCANELGDGEWQPDPPVQFETLPLFKPNAILAIDVVDFDGNGAVVQWFLTDPPTSDGSTLTSIQVTVERGAFTVVQQTLADTTLRNLTFTGLEPTADHTVRVTVTNAAGSIDDHYEFTAPAVVPPESFSVLGVDGKDSFDVNLLIQVHRDNGPIQSFACEFFDPGNFTALACAPYAEADEYPVFFSNDSLWTSGELVVQEAEQANVIVVTGLQPHTEYHLRCSASNDAGLSPIGHAPWFITLPETVPGPVNGLRSLETTTPGSVRLAWDLNEDDQVVDGYRVAKLGGTTVRLGADVDTYTFLDLGLDAPLETFTVRAINERGAGDATTIEAAALAAAPPNAPAVSLASSPTSTTVSLNIDKASDGNAAVLSGFFLSVLRLPERTLVQDEELEGSVRLHVVRGLSPLATSEIQVAAANNAGLGPVRATNATMTTANVPSPPLAPVLTRNDNNSISVLAMRSLAGDLNRFVRLECSFRFENQSFVQPFVLASMSVPAWRANETMMAVDLAGDTSGAFLLSAARVRPDSKYVFVVRAVNDAGNGQWSEEATVRTVATAIPTQPLASVGHVTTTRARLAWEKAVDGDPSPILGFRLRNSGFAVIETAGKDSNGTMLTELEPETPYTFYVEAENSRGWSNWTAVTFATAAPVVPGPPSLSCVAMSGTRVRVSISQQYHFPDLIAEESPIDSFSITWSHQSFGFRTGRILPVVGDEYIPFGTVRQLDIDNLEPSTMYQIRAQASNEIGVGQSSGAARCWTRTSAPPPQMQVPEVTAPFRVESNRIQVVWAPPEQNVDGPPVEVYHIFVFDEQPAAGGAQILRERVTDFVSGAAQHFYVLANDFVPTFTYSVAVAAENNAGVGTMTDRVFVTLSDAGCDLVRDSGARVDACGVCGGTGAFDSAGTCCQADLTDCAGLCNGNRTLGLEGGCCLASERDCNGVCAGNWEIDRFGTCCSPSSIDACNECGGADACLVGNVVPGTIVVDLLWGVAGVEETGTDAQGEPVYSAKYDPAFDAADPEAQAYLFGLCERLGTDKDLVQNAPTADVMTCPMFEFRNFAFNRGEAFPVEDRAVFEELMLTFVTDRRVAKRLGKEFLGWEEVDLGRRRDSGKGARVRWMAASFITKTPSSEGALSKKAEHDKWQQAVVDAEAEAPASVGKSTQASRAWPDMYSELTAAGGLVYGIAIAVAFAALAAVFFTASVRITLLIMATMVCVVVNMLGAFFCLGWEIGAVEAVSISIIIGSSIDHVLHSGEAYMHTHAGQTFLSRKARVFQSLTSIGPSVLNAAMTTMIAVAPLLLAELAMFSKFGIILGLNAFLSILWSQTLFPALCIRVGPEKAVASPWSTRAVHFTMIVIIAGLLTFALWLYTVESGAQILGPTGDPLFG